MLFLLLRDEDMMSLASLLSTNNSDIAPLDDFDEEDINEGIFCYYYVIVINVVIYFILFYFRVFT